MQKINTFSVQNSDAFCYMLAPMEDITDPAFRRLCFDNGAELTFTEMVRLEGLASENLNTWGRIQCKDATPVAIQLLGGKEEHLISFLKRFSPFPGFSGFNLNLGCPNPEVIKLGYGCAMIKRIERIKRLITIIKNAGYAVSVKMRLGMNEYEKKRRVYLNLIKEVQADFFIVHPRHGKETYAEPCDESAYKECIATGKPIVANGDIKTREHAEALRKLGAKGVMIGRGAVENPGIFDLLKGRHAISIDEIRADFIALSDRYSSHFRYRKNVLKRLGHSM